VYDLLLHQARQASGVIALDVLLALAKYEFDEPV
jgi:hypothetical protein